MKNRYEDCKNGKHNFEIVLTSYIGNDAFEVTRWCRVCGAYVRDLEYDGVLREGWIQSVQTPEILKEV